MVEYRSQFCEHIYETTHVHGEKGVPQNCAVDEGGCETLADCYSIEERCAGDSCTSCSLTSDCGDGEECFKGYCLTPDQVCIGGRCRTLCDNSDDCGPSGGEFTCVTQGLDVRFCAEDRGGLCGTARECVDSMLVCYGDLTPCAGNDNCPEGQACVAHRCEPETSSCSADSDCDDITVLVGGVEESTSCRQGVCTPFTGDSCAPCESDGECSGDRACVAGHCVEILADCVDNRCRARCERSAGCPVGESCQGENCLPNACMEESDLETTCLLENVYKAQTQCLQIPCPDAASDGRIKRLLPPNLDQLPEDLSPDDQEG